MNIKLFLKYFFLIIIFFCNSSSSAALVFNSSTASLRLNGTSSFILSSPLSIGGTLNILNKSNTSLQSTTTDLFVFSDAIYITGLASGKSVFSGVIDPATTDQIILDTNKSLIVDNQVISEAIEIRNAGNVIKGQPTFSSAIVLQNSSAVLNLGIQTQLNQNIIMNGGTVIMTDNLILQDGVFFSGNGAIDIGNKTLTLPSAFTSAWTGSLTFQNANDINLTGYTQLSGTWTFASATSQINGNGCILDISTAGTIAIAAGQILYLNDVHLKGLGAGGGSITFGSSTSELRLSNTTIALAGNYTFSSGVITVEGSNCTIIAKNSEQFIVSTANAVLSVNGVVLFYSPLGTASNTTSPIVATSGGIIFFNNNGTIQADYSPTIFGNIIFVGASNILANPYILCSNSQMTFSNPTPGTPINMTLDGQGNFIQFNYSTSQYMILHENVTLVMKNIMLKDFDLSLINFLGSGGTLAKLTFEDNVIVSLGKDLALSSTAIVAVGSTTINGNGKTLTLSSTDMITISTATTLTLQDMRVLCSNATAIRCLHDSSKVIMQDLTLHMTNTGMTFSRGSLDIKNNVKVEGLDQTVALGGSPIFTFNSKGNLQVLSGAKFLLDANVTFSYNPDISADANTSVSKRHLKLIDPSSVIWLNSCKFYSGLMGFALDYGQMYVDGKTSFLISPNVGGEVELGSSLQVEISPSGILDINGTLKCTTTTYP